MPWSLFCITHDVTEHASLERAPARVPSPKNPVFLDYGRSDGEQSSFLTQCLAGLSAIPRSIPSRFLYDSRGSALFERITTLEDYYLTRAENSILSQHGPEIARHLGSNTAVVEFGPGTATKTSLLLSRMDRPYCYAPVDISRPALDAAVARIAKDYPQLQIFAICADYTTGFVLPSFALTGADRAVGLFFGSSIGNMAPDQRLHFLQWTAQTLDGRAKARAPFRFLVGYDLKKEKAILERAYNDYAGASAAFNLNLVHRMNRELGFNLDPSHFRHRAFYNAAAGRIEMHLELTQDIKIRFGEQTIQAARGETINTANSYKFTISEIASEATSAGLRLVHAWTDPSAHFCLAMLGNA